MLNFMTSWSKISKARGLKMYSFRDIIAIRFENSPFSQYRGVRRTWESLGDSRKTLSKLVASNIMEPAFITWRETLKVISMSNFFLAETLNFYKIWKLLSHALMRLDAKILMHLPGNQVTHPTDEFFSFQYPPNAESVFLSTTWTNARSRISNPTWNMCLSVICKSVYVFHILMNMLQIEPQIIWHRWKVEARNGNIKSI